MSDIDFAALDWAGRPVRIEYQWLGARDAAQPLVVFLHEGLGSIALWKDFPQRFCAAAGVRGLVYSRPGYGRSTPRAPDERWGVDFMHRQAFEVLPAFLAAAGVDAQASPPWLFGHSDGGSIALLHASRFPQATAGLVVLAPHVMVEEYGLASIRQARERYLTTDWKRKLSAYHADPDSAFGGWNGIWLDPAFKAWNIEGELAAITCPLLAVQGADDEYGTLEQIEGIARRVAQTRMLVLPHCGHSPHRDQPDALIREAGRFIHQHRGA